jgi:phage FluMu gp28-like protein
MPKEPPQLVDILLPYQLGWVRDEARWKFGLMARQVGKDFSSGFEGIHDCAEAEAKKKKTTWLIAAPSERQSLESLEKWKEWASAFGLVAADYKEERSGVEALLKSATITFPGGSRVIAVPGRPDTVRGYSANVLLTEFAFFEDPDATWRAILPSITNPMRGGVKKVRLITTPNGIGNKAHDIWVKNYRPDSTTDNPDDTDGKKAASEQKRRPIIPPLLGGEGRGEDSPSVPSVPSTQWSCHFVDIYRAFHDGLPVDVDELRAAIDDPECWAQEFECQFLDVQSTLLPYELIAACETIEAHDTCPSDFWSSPPFGLSMGIDFGRRRDLTVAWTLARLGDVQQTMEVLPLEKMSTPDQVSALRPRLKAATRVCLDYTGPGVGLGDYLVREFGEYAPDKHRFGKIELCAFTNDLKVGIFSKLRMAFEKRSVRVPVNRVIREDLHSVNRVTTPGGQITYRAPHTADGHADRCTALALAWRAAASAGGPVAYARIPGLPPQPGHFPLGKPSNEVYL